MAGMQVLRDLEAFTDDTELVASVRGRRLQNEWLALQNDPPPGMTLKERRDQNTTTEWVIELKGPPRTWLEGQKFQLLFTFGSRYPYEPPQVMFTGENILSSSLVYNNGHIRLSSLTEHWTPGLTVRSWCYCIIGILYTGNLKKRKWWCWW
ncbi:ubiquitin-conjugating enzyme E2 W-like isoform X5 [Tachysurus fulvidraco]|uniref:ubiquitin-conjugating enzyme E2 W-like isoform X5 n=1 Tax=Tachysurus fulvidraco TaxID=1234273 RepID=UPI001FEF60CE|nr:ubiquitin-conjugating enzyme E2 W-like isoform X5 [Tachysurus fulvidraco]XP_026993059.2 ubiquitin-conjugating enzyme E2 W-like isoform X5 [Tachysurus fulvidraco]